MQLNNKSVIFSNAKINKFLQSSAIGNSAKKKKELTWETNIYLNSMYSLAKLIFDCKPYKSSLIGDYSIIK